MTVRTLQFQTDSTIPTGIARNAPDTGRRIVAHREGRAGRGRIGVSEQVQRDVLAVGAQTLMVGVVWLRVVSKVTPSAPS